MFSKPKIKPAFKSTAKLHDLEKDYGEAAQYGSFRVGNRALFLEDIDTRYIPLEELASIRFDVQDELAGTCCGLGAVTTHDVSFTALTGEAINIRVVNARRTYEALTQVLKRNQGIQFVTTGNIDAF